MQPSGPSDDLGPQAIDLYQRFGAFPIGDTCTPGGGSWPWWYHNDVETEKRWQEDPDKWWKWYFAHLEEEVANIKEVASDTEIKVMDHFPPQQSGEVMVPMIESLVCDIPRVLIANIFNSGNFVPGVPADFEVENPHSGQQTGYPGYSNPRFT